MTPRLCLHCSAPFSGRADKKYCCDDCRAEANRQKHLTARAPTFSINAILWRNRETLRRLWKERPTMVHREALISEGFKLQYHTSIHITKNQNTYFICYDFGFQPCIVSGLRMALVVKMISSSSIDAWSLQFHHL